MLRVHVWYEFSSSSSLLLILRRASSTFFLGCDHYELYLAGLLHWPQDGVTVHVSLCLFGVNEVKWRKRKSDIASCLKERKVLLCWIEITQTPVLLLHEDPSLLVAAHRFHTEPHYTDRLWASRHARTSSLFVHSLFVLCYFQKWLENRRKLVERKYYEMHPVSSANT